jgi:hypothetical protein
MSGPERAIRSIVGTRRLEGDELLTVLRRLAVDRLDVPAGEVVVMPDGSWQGSSLTPEQAREIIELIDGGATPDDMLVWLANAWASP